MIIMVHFAVCQLEEYTLCIHPTHLCHFIQTWVCSQQCNIYDCALFVDRCVVLLSPCYPRLLQVVQTVVESVGSVPFVFSAPYFGLIVEDVGNQTHQIFMPNLATLVAAVANKTEMLPNVSSAQLVSSASASVSGSVLAHGSRVATTIFTHDSLFQQRPNFTSVREEQRKQVGSIIMQVAIVGSLVTVTSNEDPAMYTFTKTEVYA